MRYELTSKHREFFFQRHFIELSDVLSKEECIEMQSVLDTALTKRLGALIEREKATEEERYLAGRDLFRFDADVKRFVQKRQFGELFSQISHKRPLRLLYTQYLRTFSQLNQHQQPLPLLHNDFTLGESSSFQGIHGGIIITFSTKLTELPHVQLSIHDDISVVCPIATSPGSVVLVHEASPLSYAPLFSSPDEAHLLLVYGEPNSVYRRTDEDPLTHFPKTIGYSFGDLLKEDLNPIVYR